MGFFDKLKERVGKTRGNISDKLNAVIKNFRRVDEDFFEELEEILILSDMGMETADKVMEELRDAARDRNIKDTQEIKEILIDIVDGIMKAEPLDLQYPCVLLVVGVNGVGKTTAIGKLASYYKSQGRSVMLAAADTFRAAASEQLSIWGERTGVRVIKYAEGADPAAVVFDAIDAAKHAKTDILIADTAGRLHNKKNLMAELEKIDRVMKNSYPEAQRETFLVLDATTGQNAISQAKVFAEAVPVTGIILTKLDGTAKGGVVCAVKETVGVPVRFIGVGEGVDDLQPFDSREFARAIIE
jgi:fused signal recognition particle receptor